MKRLTLLLFSITFLLTVQAQTPPSQVEKLVELEGNRLLRSDFLFQDSNYVYFQTDSGCYKLSQSKVVRSIGIKTIPTTTYYEDMLEFTKKGNTAMAMYAFGSLSSGLGVVLISTLENPNIGLGVASLGGVFSLIGVITEIGAWNAGLRANQKMAAKIY